MKDLFTSSGASFSDCGKYRYCLYRRWDDSLPMVMFIGLNPSKADKVKTDPTITRVKNFAEAWGYGGFYMLNLYAFVTPYPEQLEISGENIWLNNKWLMRMSWKSEKVICAWGAFKVKQRAIDVAAMFPDKYALVINKDGSPKHPLYVKGDTQPIPFELK